MISSSASHVPVYAAAGRCVGLLIDINQEYRVTKFCDGGSEIDGGCGLADATFLISNGDYSGHPAKR